ncbi:hypothetical protein [Povalibacter sp.]
MGIRLVVAAPPASACTTTGRGMAGGGEGTCQFGTVSTIFATFQAV